MGPVERFFAGLATAFGLVGVAPDGSPPRQAPVEYAAPTEPLPLPTPRPDPALIVAAETAEATGGETEGPAEATGETARVGVRPVETPGDGAAFAFAVIEAPIAAAVIAFVIGDPLDIHPPLPRMSPLTTGEIDVAALPSAGFTPTPLPQHDQACLLQLAALPLEAALLPPVVGENSCGIQTPLEIDTIGVGRFAVDLEPAALVDCAVAGALTEWLEADVQPAARSTLGQWVTGIRVAASYVCRGRNNDPTAPLSEHAFGNAIDISAFRLADGTWLEVQPASEMTEAEAAFLAAIRSEACGPFTTVLGPGVAMHDDHFHLDLAARRNQSLYCP